LEEKLKRDKRLQKSQRSMKYLNWLKTL